MATASPQILRALQTCTMLLTVCVYSGTAPAQRTRDYILPDERSPLAGSIREIESKGDATKTHTSTSVMTRFPVESTIQYTSFDSKTYTLHSYAGKYVRWAFPDSWLGPNGLSPQEIRQLVDQTDLHYAHMADLVRGEPFGLGLVTIAVVDIQFSGLGLVGFKGVEIDDATALLSEVKSHVAADVVTGVVFHELAHNFDIYNSYLSYYSDWAHAWTSFDYGRIYSRAGILNASAESLLKRYNSDLLFSRWMAASANATWATCVRNGGGCEAEGLQANAVWAAFVMRFVHLHGPYVLKGAFDYVKEYKTRNIQPPATPEAKNDLLVRAFAAGLGANVSCEIDAWRWSISSELRGSLAMTFPGINSFCADNDNDSFSEVQGDFDDNIPSVHPGRIEVSNGIDDDCNGYIDDVLFTEGINLDFSTTPTLQFPVRVKGKVNSASAWDWFKLQVPGPRMLEAKLTSPNTFGGWLQRHEPWTTFAFITPGNQGYGQHNVTQAGSHVFAVIPWDNHFGDYEFTITEVGQSTNPIRLSATYNGTTVSITATTDPSLIGNEQPTAIRFWADGIGFFRTIGFAQNTTFEWLTPAEGLFGIRAQLFAADSPISRATDPIFIQTSAPSNTIQFSSSTYSVGEAGNNATVSVTRSGNTAGAGTVDYAVTSNIGYVPCNVMNGQAAQNCDYTLASGTLRFAANETSKQLIVIVNDDLYAEGNETLSLVLSNASGGAIGNPSTATLTIVDNDSGAPSSNPIDLAQFFVRQHYADFLNRLPDPGGFNFWTNEITSCGSDQLCIHSRRVRVSNAFFYELEFQYTAAYVFRLYRAAYGNDQPFPNPDQSNLTEAKKIPAYNVFIRDRARVVDSPDLALQQLTIANDLVQRAEFVGRYPAALTGPQFVDALLANIQTASGVSLASQRNALITLFNQGGRGSVLYRVADDNAQSNPVNNRAFVDAEYNRSFVYGEYAGYLRRDSDIGGFLFWMGQLDRFPLRDTFIQNAMVCSFITSREYQERFSSVVTRSNALCAQ